MFEVELLGDVYKVNACKTKYLADNSLAVVLTRHIEGIALVEVAAAIGAQMFVVVHWLSPLSSTSNLGGLIGCHRHNSIYRL